MWWFVNHQSLLKLTLWTLTYVVSLWTECRESEWTRCVVPFSWSNPYTVTVIIIYIAIYIIPVDFKVTVIVWFIAGPICIINSFTKHVHKIPFCDYVIHTDPNLIKRVALKIVSLPHKNWMLYISHFPKYKI